MENPIALIEAHKKRVGAMNEDFEIGPNGMGLDLLRAVYRSSSVELSTRLRCAMACLPFETPKLLATAIVNEGSFAELLDRRLKRMEEMKLVEAKPTTNADKIIEGNPVDARLPPSIPDRRYRRF
jgi:hypothetical protein